MRGTVVDEIHWYVLFYLLCVTCIIYVCYVHYVVRGPVGLLRIKLSYLILPYLILSYLILLIEIKFEVETKFKMAAIANFVG